MNKIMLSMLVLMTLSLAQPVMAHHSAAQFDFQKPTDIPGIVKEVRVANPHMKLVLEVTDASGTRDVTYEGHSRNNLYRRGWRPNMINVGDKITITIATPKAGGDGGYVVAVKTADGHQF
jgi:hypothetical protein